VRGHALGGKRRPRARGAEPINLTQLAIGSLVVPAHAGLNRRDPAAPREPLKSSPRTRG
jgi:hypothetical protein